MRIPEWMCLYHQAGTHGQDCVTPKGQDPQLLTLAWTLSPLGTRRRSRRCPFACSLLAGSGQSSLLQGRDRDNARSLPAPSPLLPPALATPGLTISSHNRLPRRAVAVLIAHGVRNAFTLPEEKGHLGGGFPCSDPRSEPDPTPGVRTGVPLLPGATHPLRTRSSHPNQKMQIHAPVHTCPRALGGEGDTCFWRRVNPNHCGRLSRAPSQLCAKSNLSTGFLPLVGGHDQVGDDEEDVLSLENKRWVKETPPDLLGTLLPGAV